MSHLWGIDLGGTKIEGVILEKDNPSTVLFRERILTEAHNGYHAIIKNIQTLLEKMEAATGQRPEYFGIGTPGAEDPLTKEMVRGNTTCLNGNFLRKDLEEATGMKVRLANDANCFALAVSRHGIVKEKYPDARIVFAVIMGTGVGSGITIDGQILQGYHGIAGEWGHNYLDSTGGSCYCGLNGCVETIISGPALERFYFNRTGNKLKMTEIVERVDVDKDAWETQERMLYFFGKAVANVVNIIDPDVIVLGGGIGKIAVLEERAKEYIKPHIFAHDFHAPVIRPTLGDSAGVFGAALL